MCHAQRDFHPHSNMDAEILSSNFMMLLCWIINNIELTNYFTYNSQVQMIYRCYHHIRVYFDFNKKLRENIPRIQTSLNCYCKMETSFLIIENAN